MSGLTRDKRFLKAVEDAQAAFFERLAEAYPEIKTGDLSIEASVAFDNACHQAGKSWLDANQVTDFNLSREELEQLALEKAPAFFAYDLRDTIENCTNSDLQALINGNLYLTDEGRLLVKLEVNGEHVWTDHMVSFEDVEGVPHNGDQDCPVAGKFVLETDSMAILVRHKEITQQLHGEDALASNPSQQAPKLR